ncbi:hypothetical protein GCM10010156_30200 [Planobispora rosea]|nr:hypothetical protein GCM10010156_30200 [Planobispora rosea]
MGCPPFFGAGGAEVWAGAGSGFCSAQDGTAVRLTTMVAARVTAVAFARRRLRLRGPEESDKGSPLPISKVTQISCVHAK